MAAAPRAVRFLGGAIPSASDLAAAQYNPPSRTLDNGTVLQALAQLQNTVNELIARHNALAVAASQPATQVTGTAQAATNLFTNN
jgi:hypothetical protein